MHTYLVLLTRLTDWLAHCACSRDEWLSGIAEIEGCVTCGKCKSVFLDFAARHGHVIQPLVQD